jgi:hypothetical protein
VVRIDGALGARAVSVNEIELAALADKVEAVAGENWAGPLPMLYVDATVDMEQREVELVNAELERRGVNATVMAGVRSVSFTARLDSSPD